jgi:membrane-associated HD superfamily phosphohydrolase
VVLMRRLKANAGAKPVKDEELVLATPTLREIDYNSTIDLKTSHFNLVQMLLLIATAIMLFPTIAIMSTISKSPANMTSALTLLLQILTICTVLFACMLLSKIEAKIKYIKV